MLHHQEATMSHRTRTASLLLLLLIGIGTIVVPMIPPASAEPDRADWGARIAEMDQALGRHDAAAAQSAWREAYVAAHVSRTWAGMLAVGDAALRVGGATNAAELFEPRACRAYLTALLRARRQGSLDGVLAVGEAFGRLGDKDVVKQAIAVATDLAERSGTVEARQRVQVFRSQWVVSAR